MSRVLLFNKPFRVLCQFRDPQGRQTLKDFISIKQVYAAGRLDYDSEGLLVLTDDGDLQHFITDPQHKLPKTYWVQVEGRPDAAAIARLSKGVQLNDGMTAPAQVNLIAPPKVWEREPPVRFRENIPTSWLQMTITEGRNRQIRRMTAAIGFPTLRLIRIAIGPLQLQGLQPGEYRDQVLEVNKLFPNFKRPLKSKPVSGQAAKSRKSHLNGYSSAQNDSAKKKPGPVIMVKKQRALRMPKPLDGTSPTPGDFG